MFEASCHCANVKLTAKELPSSLTECNCSICRRYGALWAYYPAAKVEIVTAPGDTLTYAWDKKTIDFHRCPDCGCCTHYTSQRDDGSTRVAINARMAAPDVVVGIRLRHFDGARSWSYLD